MQVLSKIQTKVIVSLFSSKSYRFTQFPSRLKSCVFPGSLGDMSHSYEREKFPGLHHTRIYDFDLLSGSSNKHNKLSIQDTKINKVKNTII